MQTLRKSHVALSPTGDALLLQPAAHAAFYIERDSRSRFLDNPTEATATRLLGLGYDVASLMVSGARSFRRIPASSMPQAISESMSIEFVAGPEIRVLYCDSQAVFTAKTWLSRFDLVVTPESLRSLKSNYLHALFFNKTDPVADAPVDFDDLANALRGSLP